MKTPLILTFSSLLFCAGCADPASEAKDMTDNALQTVQLALQTDAAVVREGGASVLLEGVPENLDFNFVISPDTVPQGVNGLFDFDRMQGQLAVQGDASLQGDRFVVNGTATFTGWTVDPDRVPAIDGTVDMQAEVTLGQGGTYNYSFCVSGQGLSANGETIDLTDTCIAGS